MDIQFKMVKSGDTDSINEIAGWYFREWEMPPEKTVRRISGFPDQGLPFQLLMTLDGSPIATGGLYDHVGILDVVPRLKIYGPWLALVFTAPEYRNKGYGTLLCEEIENRSRELGLKEIFLFTHTAESLYRRMGWIQMERKTLKGRDAVVMKKVL